MSCSVALSLSSNGDDDSRMSSSSSLDADTPFLLAPSSRPTSPIYSDAPARLAAAYTLFDAPRRLTGSLHECKSSGGGIPELLSAGMRGAWRVSPWAKGGWAGRVEEGGLPGDEEEWEAREVGKRERRERRESEKRKEEDEVVVVAESRQWRLTSSLSAGKVGMLVGKSNKSTSASAGNLHHSPAEHSNGGKSLGEDEEILFEAGSTQVRPLLSLPLRTLTPAQLALPTTQPFLQPALTTPHHLVPPAATSTPFLALASTSTPFLTSTSTPFLPAPLPHSRSSPGPIPSHSEPLKRASTGLESKRQDDAEMGSLAEGSAELKRAASGEALESSAKRRAVSVVEERSAAVEEKVQTAAEGGPVQEVTEEDETNKARGFASLLSEGDGESEMEGVGSISRFLDEED